MVDYNELPDDSSDIPEHEVILRSAAQGVEQSREAAAVKVSEHEDAAERFEHLRNAHKRAADFWREIRDSGQPKAKSMPGPVAMPSRSHPGF